LKCFSLPQGHPMQVGVFVSTVFSILIFLGQTVLVCQSYNACGHHLKEHAQRSPN